MKTTNTVLTVLPLLLNLVGRIFQRLNFDFGQQILMSSYLALVLLIIYLIIQNGKVYKLYSIPLLLGIFQLIGSLFKILHWPGAGPLVIIGIIGSFVASFLLIQVFIKGDNKSLYLFQLILGIAIIVQILLPINLSSESIWYSKLITYPIVALSGTIILNKTTVNIGERNLILLILVQGLLFIIRHSFELIGNVR